MVRRGGRWEGVVRGWGRFVLFFFFFFFFFSIFLCERDDLKSAKVQLFPKTFQTIIS